MEGIFRGQRLRAISLALLLIIASKPALAAEYTANFTGADIQTFVNIVGQNTGRRF